MTGFNSFTQELCVDHAVVRADDSKTDALETMLVHAGVAQSVNYKTTIVDKVIDVTDALNVMLSSSLRVFITYKITDQYRFHYQIR